MTDINEKLLTKALELVAEEHSGERLSKDVWIKLSKEKYKELAKDDRYASLTTAEAAEEFARSLGVRRKSTKTAREDKKSKLSSKEALAAFAAKIRR